MSPHTINTFTRECLPVPELLRAEMLFLHLFLFQRDDAQSCTQSIVQGESSHHSPQAFAKNTTTHTAPWLHPMIRNRVLCIRRWKSGSHQSALFTNMLHLQVGTCNFPFFSLHSFIQKIQLVSLSGLKLGRHVIKMCLAEPWVNTWGKKQSYKVLKVKIGNNIAKFLL